MPRLTIDDLKKIKEKHRSDFTLREGGYRAKVTVHMGTCGIAAGARDVMAELVSGLDAKGITNVTLRQSGCIGLCDREPMMTLTDKAGRDFLYVDLTREKVKKIVAEHLAAGKPVDAFVMDAGAGAKKIERSAK